MKIIVISCLIAAVVVMATMRMSSLCSRAEEREKEDG